MANENKDHSQLEPTQLEPELSLLEIEKINHELLVEIHKIIKHAQLMQTLRLILLIIFVVVPLIGTAIYLPTLIRQYMSFLAPGGEAVDFNILDQLKALN